MSGGCQKIRYRDRLAALLALARTQNTADAAGTRHERRAYQCPACRGWHLTSQP